jgi:outer membrane murein-binding lipoprotein Lpp
MNNAILVKTDKIKIPIIVITVCSLIALAIFFIRYFVLPNLSEEATTKIVGTSELRLQSQINDLSGQISSLNSVVSQLQSQIKAVSTQIGPQPNQASLSKIDTVATQNELLNGKIDVLQAQMATMQEKLNTTSTSIGITPVNINGLSVTFITENISLGMTGPSNINTGQFAIKIANTTTSVFNNVDITGTISSSQYLASSLATGYPQLADGSGLCSYTFYLLNGIINFEAFGSGKTNLSISPGGSITIRPKISLLAIEKGYFPATNLNIALKTITYDVSTTTK